VRHSSDGAFGFGQRDDHAADGDLRLYPAGSALPPTSTINYRIGQTRANNAVVSLGAASDLGIQCDQSAGSVHFILDVNGYFQ
jgi:hypothetical protein